MQQKQITYREHNGKYIFQKDGVYLGLTKEQLIDFNAISTDILGQAEQFKNLRKLAFIISTDEALRLNDGLCKELETELRGMINPAYADVRGTESYERKRLLGEIDRLRGELENARELVAEWGAYASEYFQEKHGLADDLEWLDAATPNAELTWRSTES